MSAHNNNRNDSPAHIRFMPPWLKRVRRQEVLLAGMIRKTTAFLDAGAPGAHPFDVRLLKVQLQNMAALRDTLARRVELATTVAAATAAVSARSGDGDDERAMNPWDQIRESIARESEIEESECHGQS